jgi:ATP-dependent Zn protease
MTRREDAMEPATSAADKALLRTCYHEAAHAVAHYFLPLSGETLSLTCESDDKNIAGLHVPASHHEDAREALLEKALCLFAGSAGEALFERDGMSGGGNDYKSAVEILQRVCMAGEPKATLVQLSEKEGGEAERDPERVIEAVATKLAKRLRRLIRKYEVKASELISGKRAHVEALADDLYRAGTLDGERVRETIERVEANS